MANTRGSSKKDFREYSKEHFAQRGELPSFNDYLTEHFETYKTIGRERDLKQLLLAKEKTARYSSDRSRQRFLDRTARLMERLKSNLALFSKEEKHRAKIKQEAIDKKSRGYTIRLVNDRANFQDMTLDSGVLYIKKYLVTDTDFLMQYSVIDPNGMARIGFIRSADLDDKSLKIPPDNAAALRSICHESKINLEEIRKFFPDILAITAKKGHTTGVLHDLEGALTYAQYGAMGAKNIPLLVALGNVSSNVMSVFKQIGALCPPIIQSINALKKFLSFLGTLLKLKENKTLSEFFKSMGAYEISLLTSKILSFSLYVLTAVAYAGFLATPVGPALIAAAAAVEWIGEFVSTRAQVKALLNKRNECTNTMELAALDLEIMDAQKKYALIKKNAGWEIANLASLVLSACAPIPVVGAALLVIGITILVVVSLRNFYVSRQEAKKAKKDLTHTQTESPAPQYEHTQRERWTVRLKNSLTSGIARALDGLEYGLGKIGALFSSDSGDNAHPSEPTATRSNPESNSSSTSKMLGQIPAGGEKQPKQNTTNAFQPSETPQTSSIFNRAAQAPIQATGQAPKGKAP